MKLNIIKLKKYSDERGSLVENTFEAAMSQSHHFFVSKSRPRIIRANHYHKRKSEWFYLIQGSCLLRTKCLKTGEIKDIRIQDKDQIMINISPNIAHAFKNIGDKEMILLALVNKVHNQKKPDTYPYNLI